MSATNPLLEINPAACLLVVGPQLTVRLTQYDGMTAQALSYRSIVEAGISALQSSKAYSSREERMKDIRAVKEEARKNLVLGMQKTIHILKQQGCYEEWIKATFGQEEAENVESSSIPESVAHLLALQSQGAMLACTQYDTLLDSMADSKPFTLQEIKEWAEQGSKRNKQVNSSRMWLGNADEHRTGSGGFLHLNGVYTTPDSVHFVNSELESSHM